MQQYDDALFLASLTVKYIIYHFYKKVKRFFVLGRIDYALFLVELDRYPVIGKIGR